MVMAKATVDVAIAILLHKSKVLVGWRQVNQHQGNKHEFPGGKIEKGESEEAALIREIKEEMKCDLIVGDKVTTTTYEYDFGIVNLTTYKCKLNNKKPTLTEHKEIKWVGKNELDKLEWAPADVPAVRRIIEEN